MKPVDPSSSSGFRCRGTNLLLIWIVALVVQLVLLNVFVVHHHDDDDRRRQEVSRPAYRGIPQPSSSSTSGSSNNNKRGIPDGTFNGYPVYLYEPKKTPNEEKIFSTSHCVGENYQPLSWLQRSCHYSFFCYDTVKQNFAVVRNPLEESIMKFLPQRPMMDLSQSYLRLYHHNNTVSMGGVNLKHNMNADGIPRMEWSPIILDQTPDSFYILPDHVVLAPFHSLSGSNPGHLVWDDFLPIFTLFDMFQLLDGEKEPLMIRYSLPGGRGLWAACDWTKQHRSACQKMHEKFYPMMNANRQSKISSTNSTNLTITAKGGPKSSLICARHGVAGIGSLTDHGTSKTHGWEMKDYETTHNHGRGGKLYDFRNYAMANLGVDQQPLRAPFKIIFSMASSDKTNRNIDFTRQIACIKKYFNESEVVIESYTFKDHSVREQMEMVSQASILVTGCGGGAVTATFLPKGASVFLYYVADGGLRNNRKTFTPARLDWDIFNNLSYLRVHWIPRYIGTMDECSILIQMIRQELKLIRENYNIDKGEQ